MIFRGILKEIKKKVRRKKRKGKKNTKMVVGEKQTWKRKMAVYYFHKRRNSGAITIDKLKKKWLKLLSRCWMKCVCVCVCCFLSLLLGCLFWTITVVCFNFTLTTSLKTCSLAGVTNNHFLLKKKNGVLSMTPNCIWWWSSSLGVFEMWNILSLSLLPGPLWLGVVIIVLALFYGSNRTILD